MVIGLQHAGMSVKDLDKALAFYCGVLGMEVEYNGPFGGEIMDRITALKGTRGRAAMLRVGAQRVELFEFASPSPKSSDPSRPVCDHGISHFCIEVTNVQLEYERLKAAGVELHCAPQSFGDMKATYARDPDGNVIELLETPKANGRVVRERLFETSKSLIEVKYTAGRHIQRPYVAFLIKNVGRKIAVSAMGIAITASGSPLAAAANSCAGLTKLAFPNATITMAKAMPADSKPPPAPDWYADATYSTTALPSFCRVAATLSPSADSDIKMEVWLPADWNGKFQMVGNGGFSGAVTFPHMARALLGSYATAGTDTGHNGSVADASFAFGHPEKLVDFGWRAVHETTVKAKAVIEAYYGKAARYSYWNGCSSGGKQGLKEAQRFPEDYDGIIVGAPANNWMRLVVQQLWVARTTLPVGSPGYLPETKLPLIFKAATAACDALDGVKDGAIEDPRQCSFVPRQLLCKGDDGLDCLTAAQVVSVEKLYAPLGNPRTGEYIHAGLAPGSELMWGWVAGGPGPFPIANSAAKFIIFKDPQWDYRTFDFDRDVERALQVDGGTIDATDPNLDLFRARDGKLIQYHGWNDSGITPGDSIDYYEKVVARQQGADRAAKLAGTQAFYRLFMVPGMNHCVPGGPGADYFDMLPALERWVERGEAPDRVIAAKFKAGNWVDQKLQGKPPVFPEPDRAGTPDATRPLCPYPAVAHWTGKGDPNKAAHFVCAE